MLLRAEKDGKIHGAKIANKGPNISHLFFVNDSFIFSRAQTDEVQKIKEIIEDFCKMQGQMVHFNKSTLLY